MMHTTNSCPRAGRDALASSHSPSGFLGFTVPPIPSFHTLRMPLSQQTKSAGTELSRGVSESMQRKEPEGPQGSSLIGQCKRFLLATLRSNNTYSMIGNFFIAAHLSHGVYLQMLCAALAVRNEVREAERTHSTSDNAKTLSWGGVPGIISRSPGVYRYSLAVAFLQHAFEQGFSSVTGLAVAFCCLGLGNLFIAHDLNREYFTREGLLHPASRTPSTTPRSSMLRELLTNGAVYWGIADILVGMQGVHNNGSTLMTAPPMFLVGMVLACSSIGAVCVKSSSSPDSPVAITLNALTNYAFALANVTSEIGSAVSATAGAFWGTGSLIIGANKLSSQKRAKCE